MFYSQCTAVLVDKNGLTFRCCYLTNNPVTVAHGNKTLYVRNDVKTTCMFGYNESTECKQCLQSYRVSAEYNRDKDNYMYLEFNLNFHGGQCSEITGIDTVVSM